MLQLPDVKDIKKFFMFHRMDNVKKLMRLVSLIIDQRSCCIYKCADAMEGAIKFKSKYKKLLRLFEIKCKLTFCLSVSYLIISVLKKADKISDTICLALDRSNWKIGKFNVNVLFIGLILPNSCRFIPLMWVPLDKRGNSHQEERIELLEKFLKLWNFKLDNQILVADREFIGSTWLKFLKREGFSFVIRLRQKMYYDQLAKSLEQPKDNMAAYISKVLRSKGHLVVPIQIENQDLYYVALPDTSKNKADYICFITDKEDFNWVKAQYEKRWKIEVFFKQVKTNGFNLETMNFVDLDKIKVLIAVVSLAYVLCLVAGLLEHEKRPIKKILYKKTGKRFLSVSYFRYGLRYWKTKIKTLEGLIHFIIENMDTKITINQCFMLKSTIPILKSVY